MLADPPEVEVVEDEPSATADPFTDLRLVLDPGSLLGDLVGRVGRPMFTHEPNSSFVLSEITDDNSLQVWKVSIRLSTQLAKIVVTTYAEKWQTDIPGGYSKTAGLRPDWTILITLLKLLLYDWWKNNCRVQFLNSKTWSSFIICIHFIL